jgi:hypothetical protein
LVIRGVELNGSRDNLSIMIRRWQRICIYMIAAIWLPLSVFSHAHMTAMLVQNIGGANHPALPTAHELYAQSNGAMSEIVIVVDAALFWDAVDQYEGDCKWSAFCATLATAVPTPTDAWSPLLLAESAPSVALLHLRSISLSPDTPPPRSHL